MPTLNFVILFFTREEIKPAVRPERLLSRLKSVGEDSGPRVVTIRPPRGPDGTRGFTAQRKLWKPPEDK